MTIEIIVERDSSPGELEKAYQALAFGYRTAVFDYVRKHKIESISDLARGAGCEYPELAEQFIKEGRVAVTGEDLSRLINGVDGIGEWLKQVKHVQIHASLGWPKPMEYPCRPPSAEVIPKDTDLAIREAIAKMDWFYFESSKRFLAEHNAE
jgi:hypothetical protein